MLKMYAVGRYPANPMRKAQIVQQEDADAVDALGAEAIEQAARGKLAEHISPAEAGEQKTKAHGIKRELLLHGGAGDGEGDAVAVAEGAGDEEHQDDEVANMRRALFRCQRCAGCHGASAAISDKFFEFCELLFGEVDEGSAHRACGPSDRVHAGFDDGDGVALAAVADCDVRKDEVAEAGIDAFRDRVRAQRQ